MAEIIRLRLSPPASYRDRHRASLLRRELQTTRSRHREANEFPNDRTQTSVGKTFLHAREYVLLLVAFDEYDPLRMKTRLRQRWHKKVGSREAPDDLSLRASRYSCSEEGCGGTVHGSRAASREFMQCAVSEATSREHGVDLGHTEGQATHSLRCAAAKSSDAFAQVSEDLLAGSRHRLRILPKSR
ncbi:hypothetical protein FHT79_002394 [Rhizobium sp. BK212]|nr:hypothetical protein [Rhizobium sp. BK212]